jgi:phosphoribosylamine--glycine ligase
MRILVVGGGGREHALAWKLKQSPAVDQIFCAPGNAGTAQLGENVAIPAGDLADLARFAKQNRAGLTVVGPDDPLAAGIVDSFQGQACASSVPPNQQPRLESSKIFAKQLMRNADILTAAAEVLLPARTRSGTAKV